ncbi:MAG: ferritin-like domain-containing protein [Myxococcales bacterium]
MRRPGRGRASGFRRNPSNRDRSDWTGPGRERAFGAARTSIPAAFAKGRGAVTRLRRGSPARHHVRAYPLSASERSGFHAPGPPEREARGLLRQPGIDQPGAAMIDERSLFDIFAAGIEDERKAAQLYRRGAELAGRDTPLGQMFERMAREEEEHEKRLLEQYAEIKKSWREAS